MGMVEGLMSVTRGVQRYDDGRGECFIVCPLTICSIEECKKSRYSKTTCPGLCHVQKDYATKLHLK